MQVANADFFLKILPLFDAGDDVGMVLSPQCFYNVDVNADIFNHSNVQFWEYAQHGYDAMGFNSCTGKSAFHKLVVSEEQGAYLGEGSGLMQTPRLRCADRIFCGFACGAAGGPA